MTLNEDELLKKLNGPNKITITKIYFDSYMTMCIRLFVKRKKSSL